MAHQMPLRDAQDESPVCYCGKCGGEVYRGETLYLWDGKRVCEDCYKANVMDWLRNNPTQVADALGFEYEAVS